MATWVVTGASRGIGLELCRQVIGRGDKVIAACRTTTSGLTGLGCRVIEGVEVTDASAVSSLAAQLAGERIDVLVNNAGIFTRESLDDLDFGRMQRQLEVNALGTLRVTRALLPSIGGGGKVVIITSRMGSITDNGSGGYYGYRMSKAAVNIAAVSLARDLHPRGIAVQVLHPGMVATDMTDRQGVPVVQSAAALIGRIDELDLAGSGTFRHANGESLPW